MSLNLARYLPFERFNEKFHPVPNG